MSLKPRLFLISVALLVVLLAACRPQTATPEPPTNTAVPSTEPAPPAETEEPVEVEPTSTPGDEEPAAPPTATATPLPEPIASGPEDFPEFINPLTGQPVSDLNLLDRNPVMVKIANFPRGLRPHSGLSFADIVFEHYIGAGATRFSAIYYGQNPPEAGPVRSARLIDAQIGTMYSTVFAFASADPFVYDRVLTALGNHAISEGPNTCPALCRTGSGDVNSVRAYTDLLTEFAEEERGVAPERPDLNGTRFDPVAPEGGSAGTLLTVKYSASTISEWRYDPGSHLYTRYIEEVDAAGNISLIPLVDALTNEQLTAANVLVLFVETVELKPTLHDFILADNFSGARGLLFRDGQVYEIQWISQGRDKPIQFFDLNGELIALQPGNTWIHVVGRNSNAIESDSGEWQVFNFIP